MASSEPIDSKPSLRRRFRGYPVPPSTSQAIRHLLRLWLQSLPPSTIASFSPLKDEVDLLPLITEVPHHQWTLPRINHSEITFHHLSNLSLLVPGPFDILEPSASTPAIPPTQISVVLCPGLAFSTELSRLGRGKGFYDRFLSLTSPHTLRIGICPTSRLLPSLPTEPHDLPMHFIVSEESWLPRTPVIP